MSLLMDTREPQVIALELQRLKIPVERKQLEVGDYIVGDIVIERKAMEDFRSSIINGRVWEQASDLKANYQRVLIVLVGFYPDSHDHKLYPYFSQLLGGTFGLAVGYGIPVVNLPTDSAFASALAHLYVRTGRKAAFERPVIKRKGRSVMERREDMLCQVKGIGRVKAAALLGIGKTIQGVSNLDYNTIVDCLNLKSKKDLADSLIEVLRGDGLDGR